MKIFISYRRDDSQHQADRLYLALQRVIKKKDIFIDIDGIPAGVDFVESISDQVGQCDVLLALIGPDWLQATDADGRRRLDDPGDFVRVEIAAALKRGITVAPVLLDDAMMPLTDELPHDLAELTRRNAVAVRRISFDADTERLIQKLGVGRHIGAALRYGVLICAFALLVGAVIWQTQLWLHDAPSPLETGGAEEFIPAKSLVACGNCPAIITRSLPGGNLLEASEPIGHQHWQSYCVEVGCRDEIEQLGQYATLISWSMANQYLKWLSNKIGRKLRLPSAEELDALYSVEQKAGAAFSEWTMTCHEGVHPTACSYYEVRGRDRLGKRRHDWYAPESRGRLLGFRAVASE